MTGAISPGSSESEMIAWLLARNCDVERFVPEHMRGAICRYIIFGVRCGQFLTALLSNDLMEAYGRADETNIANMRNWVMFLYNDAPGPCYGSPERVADWKERGGLAGKPA